MLFVPVWCTCGLNSCCLLKLFNRPVSKRDHKAHIAEVHYALWCIFGLVECWSVTKNNPLLSLSRWPGNPNVDHCHQFHVVWLLFDNYMFKIKYNKNTPSKSYFCKMSYTVQLQKLRLSFFFFYFWTFSQCNKLCWNVCQK